MASVAESEIPEWAERLRDWQQGDYTLDVGQIVVVDAMDGADLSPLAGDAVGIAVVSQTCDIVNWGTGREWVVVSPLVEVDEARLENVRHGTTPAMALLTNPPRPNIVVDLSQAMTVHKSVIAKLTRASGLRTDRDRTAFADAIARKYGRFAFPDAFAEGVLRSLRARIKKSHGRASDQGRTYASIDSVRVAASPSWDSSDVTVGFRFILAPEGRRNEDRVVMNGVLAALLENIEWPAGFRAEDPPFTLLTTDEMSATEWLDSQEVDWQFISWSR